MAEILVGIIGRNDAASLRLRLDNMFPRFPRTAELTVLQAMPEDAGV
jgi:hypothetical protein